MFTRTRITIGAVAAAVALAVGCGLADPGVAAAPPNVYADATGDAKSAPDIDQVTIADRGDGTADVDIRLTASDALGSGGGIIVLIDADRNAKTGSFLASGRNLGVDYEVVAVSAGVGLLKWNGSEFAAATTSIGAAFNGLDLTFTLPLRALGATTFDFVVGGVRGDDVDVAPDPSPATYPKVVSIKSVLVPRSVLTPKAGGVARVQGVKVRLADDTAVAPDGITCRLTYNGKALAPLVHGCAWRIPKRLKGKKLVLALTVFYLGQTMTLKLSVKPR